ncbi:hypothetical protein D3C75_783090 [compost metagenome]
MKSKKYPRSSLDTVVSRYADGHYVEQSLPGANPKRDKMVSEAVAKLKTNRPVKARS